MFELFDHTADVGIRVRAADLAGLFAEAARALFSLLVENVQDVRPRVQVRLDLTTPKLEDLFFDWLSELLYQFEVKHLLLSRFDVTVQGAAVHAVVFGEPLDADRHQLGHEVKAITYHGLTVRHNPDGWLAEVIVDI